MNDYKLDAIVLHYCLLSKKFLKDVIACSIKPDSFDPKFRYFAEILFSAMNNSDIQEVLSPVALSEYAQTHLKVSLEDAVKIRALHERLLLCKTNEGLSFDPRDFNYWFSLFKNKQIDMILAGVKADLDKSNSEDSLKKIKKTLSDIDRLKKVNVFDQGSVSEDSDNMLKEYFLVKDNPTSYKGVLTGYKGIDDVTNGFFPGELILIAGNEGTGKSLLMMNMAVNAWVSGNSPYSSNYNPKKGANVVNNYIEMPRSNRGQAGSSAYLNRRIISCLGEIPFSGYRKGQLNPFEENRLKKTLEFTKLREKDYKFYVVDIPRGATVGAIESKLLEISDEMEIDLVVIDYLNIMKGGDEGSDSDWKEQGNIAAELHELARMYRFPILTASQANRASGKNGSLNEQKYNTTRLGRSALIGQNVNMAFQIANRDNEREIPLMELHWIKNRDGPQTVLNFLKRFDLMRVYNENDKTTEDIPAEASLPIQELEDREYPKEEIESFADSVFDKEMEDLWDE